MRHFISVFVTDFTSQSLSPTWKIQNKKIIVVNIKLIEENIVEVRVSGPKKGWTGVKNR